MGLYKLLGGRAGPRYSQFIRKRTLSVICRKKKAEKQMLKESEVFPCAIKISNYLAALEAQILKLCVQVSNQKFCQLNLNLKLTSSAN